MLKELSFSLDNTTDLLYMAKALDSPQRLDILRALEKNSLNVTELAQITHIPLSSCAHHVNILQESGLVITDSRHSSRGQLKLCSRDIDIIHVHLFENIAPPSTIVTTELPIGSYTDYEITSPCGIITPDTIIGNDNDPDNFFLPLRHQAGILWFTTGYVEYRISKKNIPSQCKSIEVDFEACSEAPYYRNDWKSDITVWINGVEVGTWTCPGDFGGRRGRLNPAWWPDSITQFGMLSTWEVTETQVLINGEPQYGPKLSDLKLHDLPYITLRIGVKENAVNKGGLNLFGAHFGDFPQDIVFRASYE